MRVACLIHSGGRHTDAGGAQRGSLHAPQPEVGSHRRGSLAAVEVVRQVCFRDLEGMARGHLHPRQAVSGRVLEAGSPEEAVGRAAIHDQPLHLVDDLPHGEQAQRVLGRVGGELGHLCAEHADQSRDVLRRLRAVARASSSGGEFRDEDVLERRVLGQREGGEVRREVVARCEAAAVLGKREERSVERDGTTRGGGVVVFDVS